MPKQVIYSTSLQEFRPVIWYGQPLYTRYAQIRAVILEKLGEKYANLLAEPVVTKDTELGKGKAHWMSDYLVKSVSFSKLTEAEQESTRQNLTEIIGKIKKFAKELQEEVDANSKELGELITLAIEIPGVEYIFVEEGKIAFALWGFTSEIAIKNDFRISKVLDKSMFPPIISEEIIETKNEIQPNITLDTEKITEKQTTIQTSEAKKPEQTETKKSKKSILWFILVALLMFIILFLIWFFFLKNPKEQTYLPPESNILPPIDTTQVGIDPNDPTKRPIFTDKFNVALQKNGDIKAFAKKIGEKYSSKLEIIYYDTVIKLVQIKTAPGEWKQWADTVKKMSEVRLVFNEALFQKSLIPSDPAFKEKDKNWYFEKIQAYEAWDITKGNEKVVVAIIDNGFDLNHKEFKGKIVNAWNVYNHSDKLFPVGKQGSEHGTHVAATAVGLMDNNEGLSGIAPNCKLMPIQVGDENGTLSSLSIVSGILYAIHKNADVVNMSLGMMFPDEIKKMSEEEQKKLTETLYPDEAQFWDEIYKFALESNIVFVQAAGNDNILAGIDPAARSKNTIIVSAADLQNTKAEFSNFGQLSVISAPGVQIYSAIPDNKYEVLQGTSMASPIVTGAVALMKSKFPNYKPEQIISILIKTAKPINSKQYIGPMLQIANALKGDTSQTELVIPKDAKDIAFAEGRWKSSNELISTIDKCKISLYFDIEKSGDGKLTLVEEKDKGATCISDLKVSFKNGKLVIEQTDNALCDVANKSYRPYLFECVQGTNNSADCKAMEKNSTSKVIDFKLYKQY